MLTSFILSAALIAGCENGTCHAPVRHVVAKTRTVVVDKQVARTVTKKTVHRGRAVLGRIVFWR